MNANQRVSGKRVFYRFEGIDETVCAENVEILDTETFEPEREEPEAAASPKEGFWRRQYGSTMTDSQRKFDWAFGVFMPMICFYFDPFVFRETPGNGLLGAYQAFAYLLAFVSIMSTAAWLLWGDRLGLLGGVVAGLLLAGSVISLAVGAILFPFSVIGMFVLIGLLGFTPLFSAVVFSRNGIRSFRAARPHFEKQTLYYTAGLAGLAALALPYVINSIFLG